MGSFWRPAFGFGRELSLPFWSAPGQRHHRLALRVGIEWIAGFLDCVAEGAKTGVSELIRLQRAEEKGQQLARTARSRLPDALDSIGIVHAPIVTAQVWRKGCA